MAETLTGTISVAVLATLSNVLNFSTPKDPLSYTFSQAIANGTAAGQANKLWHDTRTLAASANESLNLYTCAGATSGVGGTYTLSKVFAIIIKNKSSNGGNITIGGNGTSSAWTSLFGNNAYTATIRAGGYFIAIAPDATGYAVVNTTNHLLKIANADAVNAVDYDIIVIGAQ